MVMNLYVLLRSDGKYFKPRGMSSGYSRWVDDVEDARFYNTPGKASAQIKRLQTYYNKYDTKSSHTYKVIEFQVIKKLPWTCIYCGEKIYTITQSDQLKCFIVRCGKCGGLYEAEKIS